MNGNETMEQVVDRVMALETSDDFDRYVKQVFKALPKAMGASGKHYHVTYALTCLPISSVSFCIGQFFANSVLYALEIPAEYVQELRVLNFAYQYQERFSARREAKTFSWKQAAVKPAEDLDRDRILKSLAGVVRPK